jgi:hypothetical protein
MHVFSSMRQILGAQIPVLTAFSVLAAPALVQAEDAPQVLDFVGGNSSNNALLWLNFGETGPAAVQLNDDANTRTSLRSFEFFKNNCGVNLQLDVIAADTNRGEIIIYPTGRGISSPLPCAEGACPGPARPDGLSSSNERLLAAAETGTAGTVPGVWIYEPGCFGAEPQFESLYGGQLLTAEGPVTGIADTEFVRVLGGGLTAGDLLVLTSNPTTIARVRAADIRNLRENGQALTTAGAPAEVLVGSSFFGGSSPTGMAFVPGTAGIGGKDTPSESEDLLVTLSGGSVLRITFTQDTSTLARGFTQEIFVDGLGNGPLGIAAGTRNDKTYMIVADRQQGRFYRYELFVEPDGNLPPPLDGYVPDEIKDGVQNPQGVAINSDFYSAANCASGTGCEIRRTAELQFITELDLKDNSVFANIFVVPDTPDLRDRRGFLQLSQVSDEFDPKFLVPPSCRGFPLPDDPSTSVLVVLGINTDVRLGAGEFAQTTERANQIIAELGECTVTGARLYYHPDAFNPASEPEKGRLYDTTYHCENPSRSISREYSPIVLCADDFFLQVRSSTSKPKITGKLAKSVQAEVNLRTDNLQVVVNLLGQGVPAVAPGYTSLQAELSAYLAAAKEHVRRNRYLEASLEYDKGAISVANSKASITSPTTLYGDLLGRFLSLAFFTKDSLSEVTYSVPGAVCDVESTLASCPSSP